MGLESILINHPRSEWLNEFTKLENIVVDKTKGITTEDDEWEFRCIPEQLAPYYEFPYEEGEIVVDMQTTDLYLLISYPVLDSRSPEFNPAWIMEMGNTYIAINITEIHQADECIYIPDKARYQLANDSERISDNTRGYQKLIREGKYSEFYEEFLKDNNFDKIIRLYL